MADLSSAVVNDVKGAVSSVDMNDVKDVTFKVGQGLGQGISSSASTLSSVASSVSANLPADLKYVPSPETISGWETLKSNFKSPSVSLPEAGTSQLSLPNIDQVGLEKLKQNLGAGGGSGGISVPDFNWPQGGVHSLAEFSQVRPEHSSPPPRPLPSTLLNRDRNLLLTPYPPPQWLNYDIDDSARFWIFGGVAILTTLLLKAGGADDAPVAVASPPSPVAVSPSAPAPAPAPAAKAAKVNEKKEEKKKEKKKLITGKPGDPSSTLADSRLALLELEQEMRAKELQAIQREADAMRKKLEELGTSPPSAVETPAVPPASKPKDATTRKKKAQITVDPALISQLRTIDGFPEPPAPAPAPAPAPTPAPPAPAPAPIPSPVEAAKAAAKAAKKPAAAKPASKAAAKPASGTGGFDDWSTLSAAALKKKTVKDLREFIKGKGVKVGSKAKKAELLEVVEGILKG